MILPYYQAALCTAVYLVDFARFPRTLAQLLRGGIGPGSLLALAIILVSTQVFFESHQCVYSQQYLV